MQKFLAYIKQEWEITTLAVTTAIVLVAAAAWVSAFVFGKDGTIEKPTVLPQPPEYFQTDNTDYLNYYAVNKAKVNPFLFKHKVPPTPAPPPPKLPKGGGKEQTKQQSTPAPNPPDKPAPKQPDKQPDKPAPKPPPPPPPVIVTLSYDGFYQGISGIPQAMMTYAKTQDKKKLETASLTEKASSQFKSLFALKSIDQEKIIVIFQGKETTIARGKSQKFTLP